MKLKRNLNNIDRTVRIGLGFASVYFGFVAPALIGNPVAAVLLGLFGVINIFAAMTSHCPVYNLANISTYSPSHPRQKSPI